MPIEYIDREECIGDSLFKINNNFADLNNRINSFKQILPSSGNTTLIYVNASNSAAIFSGPLGDVAVNNGGNDTTGTGSTSAPFKTLHAALKYLYSSDIKGNNTIEIRLCPGMYDGCTISGMPPTNGVITGNLAHNRNYIYITGSSQSNTFITQHQLNTYHTAHLYICNGAYIGIQRVGFRYNSLLYPFIPTATPGGGTRSDYTVVGVDLYSSLLLSDVTFEAVPLALTTSNPQETLTRYLVITNNSILNIENVIINNGSWVNGVSAPFTTQANARYFINVTDNSRVFMNSVVTLQGNGITNAADGPRFSAFIEPSRNSYVFQNNSSFNFLGNFGSRLGTSGTEGSFGSASYRPGEAKNYLMKLDGPHSWANYRYTSSVPSNCFKSAFSTTNIAAHYSIEARW